MFQRYAPLNDLSTRAESGVRYIDAYAAVFDTDQEIRDRDGHYMERINRTAFDRTIGQRGTNFQVLFNHGRTIHGESSAEFSKPYGVPEAVRADARGVWTSTRMMDTPLGDEIYTLARGGALRGMSFSGQFRDSKPAGRAANGLPIKERTEVAMIEYGATPFPAYGEAQIVAVRADFREFTDDELASLLSEDDALRSRLAHLLASPDTGHAEPATSPATGRVALTQAQRTRWETLTKGTRT